MSAIDQRIAAFAASLKGSGAAGRRHQPLVALFWVTIAMAGFAGTGAFGKLVINAGMHPLQVIAFRNLFCLLLLLPLLFWRGPSIARSRQLGLYGARVGLAMFSMACWFLALAAIPFSELTAINFLAPLFATAFAVLWLGEKVRARRMTALAVGFIGALIILRPGGSALGAGQMFALVSALTSGMIGPLLKQMTVEDDADKIVFITNMIMTPLSFIPAWFVWQAPAAGMMPYLMAMGLCAVIGHIAFMRGMASAEASLVFTFEFSRLPFAVAIGWFLFGEVTDVWTWVGALVIFGAATYITRREAVLARSGLARPRDVSDPLLLTPLRLRV